MILSTFLIAEGRGGDIATSTGLIILAGVLVVLLAAGLALHQGWIGAKRRTRGDRTREGGTQPPGRVGRL